ncbi:polymerase delta-interacting protein 3-like [Cimex lectularius]|uniref:RRM domain-containing protein n=1 Tax=Cimex lectularius TaxID=79782 RepID=A0A8I6S2B4_CIMLE|nr:polymerase delta-interacting protein 3-like [Cimex lectularius]
MDVGLDEIIKRKRRLQGKRSRGPLNGKGPMRGPKAGGIKKKLKQRKSGGNSNGSRVGGGGGGTGKIVDARFKIIEKTRSKIVDARERLNQRLKQTDARERILRKSSISSIAKVRGEAVIPRRTIRNPVARLQDTFGSTYRTARPDPYGRALKTGAARGSTAYMDIDSEWNTRLNALPHLEVHLSRIRDSPPAWTPMVRSPEERARKGNTTLYRAKEDIKSRLEPIRQEGYRIVVSNLQPSVTHEDIKELFEDIGTLIGSRVVRPGTAEVVYKNMEDAVTAVDTYHNRQLDGQPMKCLLVKPRTNNNSPASKSIGTKGCIVPDTNTVHKALFMK